MAQNQKPIFPDKDRIFQHNGKNILIGFRINGETLQLVGGEVLNNLYFDQQIQPNFNDDEFGDYSNAALLVKLVMPLKLYNEKLVAIYGSLPGGQPPVGIEQMLLKLQQFLKENVVYDPAVGVKLK